MDAAELLPRVDRKGLKTDRKISGLAVYCIREGDTRIVHRNPENLHLPLLIVELLHQDICDILHLCTRLGPRRVRCANIYRLFYTLRGFLMPSVTISSSCATTKEDLDELAWSYDAAYLTPIVHA
jgi:hypothetical protein